MAISEHLRTLLWTRRKSGYLRGLWSRVTARRHSDGVFFAYFDSFRIKRYVSRAYTRLYRERYLTICLIVLVLNQDRGLR